MAAPNVGSDPINPAYYAGTACAEIIEHMPTNVGFAVKYAWRLGEKDSETQEAGKAIWYLRRELCRRQFDMSLGRWFISHGHDRINLATRSGKLDFVRGEIVSECVMWCVNRAQRHLERAIMLFQTYTGETTNDDQDHEQ